MKNTIVILGGLFLIGMVIVLKINHDKCDFNPEYELEILNQDSVKIRSLSTGRIYKERFDKVHEALLKDNL